MKQLFFLPLISTIIFLGCPDDEPCTNCPTPLDTTSHAFTWQTFTWGGGGASSINDVAIINDTNIWAVGDVNLPDSIAQDQLGRNPPFGAAQWNGTEWKLFRLPAIVSPTYTEYLPITGIIAFSSTDIWLASGGGVHKFNGNNIMQSYWLKTFPGNNGILNENQSSDKLWGTSSSNLYAVGRNGAIAHYNGSVWQKVESGTTLDFTDIWGAKNAMTGEYEILAIAARAFQAPALTELFRIRGTTITKVFSRDDAFTTVYFQPNEKYYFGGNGMAWKNSLSDTAWNQYPYFLYTKYFISRIRGNGLNDFFSVGSFMEVAHYNGSTWYNYSNEIPIDDGGFGTLTIKSNSVVIGGQLGQHALLLIGKR